MKTQEQALYSLWDKPQKHNCYCCPSLKRKLHWPLQLCRPLLVACAKFSCAAAAAANTLPYQFVDELKEFECTAYSLSTYSDPSHLLSLSHLLGQSEPAPMTAPVGHSVHRMGWMICLFFIHLFTLR
jgi:hypothetical protein